MKYTYNEFVGQGKHSLEVAEFGSAVRATRAVLTVVADIVLPGTVTKISDGVPKSYEQLPTQVDSERAE